MANLVEVRIVLRKDGHFYLDGKKIKAYHPGDGYGVDLVIEPSQVDVDFGGVPSQILYNALKGYNVKLHLFISWDEWKQVNDALDISDIKTFKLRNGEGWTKGPRPFDREGLKIRASDVL